MVTLKDIIKSFENYTKNHPQINDFGFGNISNINTEVLQFPCIWLNPLPSNQNNSSMNLNFDVYYLDLMEQNRSNLIDIMSNMLILSSDTISNFWQDLEEEKGFDMNSQNVGLTPFEGKFDHLTAGFVQNINIQYIAPINCEIIP